MQENGWHLSLLCAAALAAGCGRAAAPPEHACTPGGFCVNGVPVEGLPAALQTAEVAQRLQREIDLGLGYWGADWGALRGWRIVYVEGDVPCNLGHACSGFTSPEELTISLSRYDRWGWPVEFSQLPHELGHVAADDPDHRGDRWRAFDPLWGEVMGPVAPSVADCSACNMWNHAVGP